jgi:Mn2+/Fe2+ NRAMP family transporter
MSDSPSVETANSTQAEPSRIEQDRRMINEAREEGTGALFWAFTKLSGPGWLQSAITLGGGSLAGSLYLGVLAGFGLMWLQPLAMIMGVIMLSAIGYVALSTGERPFQAINNHVNPVLGWAWAIATLMANMVWCMPQFALGSAALKQNLSPAGIGGIESEFTQNLVCVALLLGVAGTIVWFYDSGGKGIKLFEMILKAMVGLVVVCFFGVVIKMSLASDGLDWGAILSGFIPDFSLLSEPSPAFAETLAQTGSFADHWKNLIVSDQQKVMITAAATAVGINMTFLLPYSMLQKGWDRDFRGLAIFDLATGLFIPFVLATSCVVIAAATQFHAQPEAGFVDGEVEPAANLVNGYNGLLDGRVQAEVGDDAFAELDDDAKQAARDALPVADRTMAAMIVKRDAFNLANSLKNLVGEGTAQYVFGLGVLAMAVSTIIILMLINGFVVCEMLGLPSHGTVHRIGCYAAGLSGALGPFVWSKAGFWLAVPTSMFGMCLLPIAYVSFLFMMNSRSLLGENMPTGGRRLRWNAFMIIATALAAFGAFWSIKTSGYATEGYAAMGILIALAAVVQVMRAGNRG